MVISFYTITSFINFLTSAILAVLVILKNKRGQKNIAFFVLATIVALWSLSYFFWQNTTDDSAMALFWCRTLIIFVIMIPAAYLHFILAITETLEKKRGALILVYLFFYSFILINLTPIFINQVEPIMNFKYWPVATPIFSIFLFCFIVSIVYSSFLLIKKYKLSTGLMRLQIKYVAIGMIIAFISGSSNFIPWYKISIPPIGNALVPIYIIFMAYTITRHKLMDIKILARNILFYFGIAFFIYALFYGVAWSYKIIFGDVLATEAYLVGLFLAPLLAVFIYSSSNFLSFFINKHVFRSIYIYQQAIKKASYNLSRYTNLNEIASVIINTIKETLQPSGIAVLLISDIDQKSNRFEIVKNDNLNSVDSLSIDYDLLSEYFKKNQEILTRDNLEQLIQDTQNKEKKMLFHKVENQLHKYNIFICAPLKNNTDLIGVIVMNNKKYENAYTQEDFDLLETLSHYAQIAIDNDFLYKKINKEDSYLKKATKRKTKKR